MTTRPRLPARHTLCLGLFIAFPSLAYARADETSTPNLAIQGAEAPGGGADIPPVKPVVAAKKPEVATIADAFKYGTLTGYTRLLYYTSANAFFSGYKQDTATFGGGLGYTSAPYLGFSMGVEGYLQRGIGHSVIPEEVDTFLGPDVTTLGQAYVKWEHNNFGVTVGDQKIDIPFASDFDYRVVPQLYQGISTRYGDADNYVTLLGIDRFKSWSDSSFTKNTNYNSHIDSSSPVGTRQTPGFIALGGGRKFDLGKIGLSGQGWYTDYVDYGRLGYLEGQIIENSNPVKPFLGLQYFHESGDGKELVGHVDSDVYGSQLGLKYHSINATVNYDRITPHASAYGNGSLVTPYAHFVSSGPIFAAPFFVSTQDLGAGNAYSTEITGSPIPDVTLGARYSFMDLKSSAGSQSIRQSEYLTYAILDLSKILHGLTATNFIGLESRPGNKNFIQNRLALQYEFAL